MGIGQFFKNFVPGAISGFSGLDGLKSIFSLDTFLGIWDLGKAIINGDITLKDIASAVGASMAEPFKYIFDHSKEIWKGNPSDAAVKEYGVHFGNALQMIVGAVGGGGVIGAKLMKALGKVAPKLCKTIDKIASDDSILRKLPFCFTSDTLVYTSEGHKEIKDIKAGDEVYAENPQDGQKALKKVTQVFINKTDTILHVDIGETVIDTTQTHPFYVEDKGWILAGALEEGDKLHMYSGESVVVEKVTREVLKEKILVYNLEVEDFHTYYVSDKSVLVHNECKFELPKIVKAAGGVKGNFSVKGFSYRIDTNKVAPGEGGFHIHIFRDDSEIAKLNGRGGFVESHGGSTLLKPSEINKTVRNEINKLVNYVKKNLGDVDLK